MYGARRPLYQGPGCAWLCLAVPKASKNTDLARFTNARLLSQNAPFGRKAGADTGANYPLTVVAHPRKGDVQLRPSRQVSSHAPKKGLVRRRAVPHWLPLQTVTKEVPVTSGGSASARRVLDEPSITETTLLRSRMPAMRPFAVTSASVNFAVPKLDSESMVQVGERAEGRSTIHSAEVTEPIS